MKIQVLTHAKEDLFDGYLFYERQESGIGDYFLDSLSADIESLLLHHGYHRQFCGFHRMIARVFPFFIYYRVTGETIYVDAVVDQRKKSGLNQTPAPAPDQRPLEQATPGLAEIPPLFHRHPARESLGNCSQ